MKTLDPDFLAPKQFGRFGWFCLCLCLRQISISLGSSLLLPFVLGHCACLASENRAVPSTATFLFALELGKNWPCYWQCVAFFLVKLHLVLFVLKTFSKVVSVALAACTKCYLKWGVAHLVINGIVLRKTIEGLMICVTAHRFVL